MSNRQILRNSNLVFIGINGIVVITCAYVLYFSSHFWLGTQEQHQALIKASSIPYFAKRFLLNLIFIVVAMGLIMMLARIPGRGVLKDSLVKKILLIDALFLFSFSTTMICRSMT
ncbi:MAG TPA: hypothetical protein VEW65_14895 [Chryseolinea sp.]|nr:hypothetical protein [Chryseolinea sp.]